MFTIQCICVEHSCCNKYRCHMRKVQRDSGPVLIAAALVGLMCSATSDSMAQPRTPGPPPITAPHRSSEEIAAPPPPPPRVKLPQPAIVEGYLLDAKTKAGVQNVRVTVRSTDDDVREVATTDDRGHYELLFDEPVAAIDAFIGSTTVEKSNLTLTSGKRTRVNLLVSHREVVAARADALRCPHSPPGAVIEGHTTSQADIDGVSRAVLLRYASDRASSDDASIAAPADVPVSTSLRHQNHRNDHLSSRAIPTTSTIRFIPSSITELQTQADQQNASFYFIDITSLYSDGSCAVVSIVEDIMAPTSKKAGRHCRCTADDVYQKRGGKWHFVKRNSVGCG